MSDANVTPVQILFAVLSELITLFNRHKNGEDISADLDALQTKVRLLKDKEIDIANG